MEKVSRIMRLEPRKVSGWAGRGAIRGYGGSSKTHANSNLGMETA